jgi:hypothetical protein
MEMINEKKKKKKKLVRWLTYHSSVDKIFYDVKMPVSCSHMKCCNKISAGLGSNIDRSLIGRIEQLHR